MSYPLIICPNPEICAVNEVEVTGRWTNGPSLVIVHHLNFKYFI